MKSMSFDAKIRHVAFFLYGSLLIMVLAGAYGLMSSRKHIEDLGHTQIPAVRLITLGDMMHDGMRAVVYRAIVVSKDATPEERAEVLKEAEEFSNNFKAHMDELDKLTISPQAHKAIAEIRIPLEKYAASTMQITKVALSGNERGAREMIPAFQESFELLEAKMMTLGEEIEGNSEKSAAASSQAAQWLFFLIIGLGFASFAGGIMIYRFFLTTIFTELKSTGSETITISSATQQVNQSIQGVSSAVAEMSHSIREIGSSSSEAARVAREAVDIGVQSNEKAIQLQISSDEIGKVTRLISQVAERTSMLALNATIEAARAGEAGRGFAVVADEVKDLAKQTSEATDEITKKIQAIQGDSQEIVTSLRQVTDVVNRISDLQSTIASAVEEQTVTVAEISKNLSQAADGTQDISGRLKTVAQMVRTSNTTTGHSNSTSYAA